MQRISSSSFLLFPLMICFISSAAAMLTSSQSNNTAAISSQSACKSTLYPKLCRSILSAFGSSPTDRYGYGKFSVKQCLKQAERLSKSISYYLTHYNSRSKMSVEEVGALEDCRELAELNVDYLGEIWAELDKAESFSDELVEKVGSLLSGVVTNQQTCFDGLVQVVVMEYPKKKSGNVNGGVVGSLFVPLSNATRLYSVSLGLVTHALERNLRNNRRTTGSSASHQQGVLFPRNHVREPLESLIKALRKSSCHTPNNCTGRQRRLVEMAEHGILVSNTVIVSLDGNGNFTSIGDAIAVAPNNSKPADGYFVIYAREGSYQEYVIVPKNKKNIMLIGDGINRTVITGNHSVIDGWTTFNSSTFAVSGERFVAVDITFRNTAGPEKHQAVALRNNADLSTFYRCSFEGYQDTLYVHSMRQFYRECDIYGTVDFIFGNAAAVFQSCNLYARKPLPNQKNAFTAQGRTDPNQNTGISIHHCTIEAAPDLAMDLNSTLSYLGRPWKEYSRTVYMQSYIGRVIDPVGWLEWNGTIGLETLYYGEFENYGPGANTSMRVQWRGYNLMNISQAMNFTVFNFTMGDTWLPNTDIPFSGGLLA